MINTMYHSQILLKIYLGDHCDINKNGMQIIRGAEEYFILIFSVCLDSTETILFYVRKDKKKLLQYFIIAEVTSWFFTVFKSSLQGESKLFLLKSCICQ